VVHALLEWLAEAEQTLRFHGVLPDDEDALRTLIDQHKVSSFNRLPITNIKCMRNNLIFTTFQNVSFFIPVSPQPSTHICVAVFLGKVFILELVMVSYL
jgi:hypothetical protein